MSIADRISSMANNLSSAYGRIAYLGVDTSSIDKNIQNLSNVLDTVYNDYPKVSDEGISPSIEGSKAGRLSTVLKGNTSQDGTPTPDNPVDINVVKGENSVTVCGKNIMNPRIVNQTSNGITCSYNELEQSYTFNGTCTVDNTVFGLNRVPVQFIYNLTVSSTHWLEGSVTGYCTLRSYDRNFSKNCSYSISELNVNNPVVYSKANSSFVCPTNMTSIRFNAGSVANNFKIKVMMANTDNTTYSPYTGITLPITLPTGMELCKIGDYQDYIYRENGNWYKYSAVGKIVLNGSETIKSVDTSTQTYKRFCVDIGNNIITAAQGEIGNFCCDKFQAISRNDTYYNQNGIAPTDTSFFYYSFVIYYDDTKTMSIPEFQTWLSTHNVTVYYVLATPTTTQITDTTLISQLNALYNAMSYNGQTNILQTNADLPFIISASALKAS